MVSHCFCSLLFELHESSFPVSFVSHFTPAPPVGEGTEKSTQNPIGIITFTEHLLHASHLETQREDAALPCVASFTRRWLFPCSLWQLHCLSCKCVVFIKSPTKLLFVYSWLFAYSICIVLSNNNIHHTQTQPEGFILSLVKLGYSSWLNLK